MSGKSQKFLKKYMADLILIVVVMVVGIVALLIQKRMMKAGKTVYVIIAGNETKSFSLDDDVEYKIEADDTKPAKEYNILVIKDGKAYISEATCGEQICVKHNAISNTGETIVCLPHKLTVEIK